MLYSNHCKLQTRNLFSPREIWCASSLPLHLLTLYTNEFIIQLVLQLNTRWQSPIRCPGVIHPDTPRMMQLKYFILSHQYDA